MVIDVTAFTERASNPARKAVPYLAVAPLFRREGYFNTEVKSVLAFNIFPALRPHRHILEVPMYLPALNG